MFSTARHARRLVPAPLLPSLVRWRTKQALRDPAVIRLAELHMEFLLGKSRRASEVPQLARRYVEFMMWRAEWRYRPATITHQRVKNIEMLTGRDRGRGMILNFMHHGQYDGLFGSLRRAGAPQHIFIDLSTRRQAYRKQHLRLVARGGPLVPVDGGFRAAVAALRPGVLMDIATDIPGHTPVTFLGREVLGSFGAARAAFLTDSPVAILTTRRDEQGNYLQIDTTLDPRDFDAPPDLLTAIVRAHEPAILDWPEAVESPLHRWAAGSDEDRARFPDAGANSH